MNRASVGVVSHIEKERLQTFNFSVVQNTTGKLPTDLYALEATRVLVVVEVGLLKPTSVGAAQVPIEELKTGVAARRAPSLSLGAFSGAWRGAAAVPRCSNQSVTVWQSSRRHDATQSFGTAAVRCAGDLGRRKRRRTGCRATRERDSRWRGANSSLTFVIGRRTRRP